MCVCRRRLRDGHAGRGYRDGYGAQYGHGPAAATVYGYGLDTHTLGVLFPCVYTTHPCRHSAILWAAAAGPRRPGSAVAKPFLLMTTSYAAISLSSKTSRRRGGGSVLRHRQHRGFNRCFGSLHYFTLYALSEPRNFCLLPIKNEVSYLLHIFFFG